MKIRICSLVLAIGLLILMVSSAFADSSEELMQVVEEVEQVEIPTAVFYLDGQPLEDVVAESVNGTYYVALSSIVPFIDPAAVVEEDGGMATVMAEAVVVTETEPAEAELTDEESEEAEPAEEPEGQAVAEVLDTLVLTAVMDECYVVANGRYLYVEDGVKALDGMAAIPVRTLAQVLGMSVRYDAESGQVHLSQGDEIGYLEDDTDYYDPDDLYWLSRIIYCESGNQSLAGKIAVGNVVLNRVNNSKFPDSVYDVIFQKNQFSPASGGSINRSTPNEQSIVAAKLVLDGAEVLGNALFFNRAGVKCYASKNRTYIATIGEHAFYA